MDFLILFILIIIIIYLINFKGTLEEKVTELTKKLDLLKKEITSLKSDEVKQADKIIPNVITQQVKKVEPKEEITIEPIRKEAPLPKIEPNQSHKIGYPILWGICSFLFMTFGMNKKLKELRIISLSVFLIILLKLFIIDFRDMSEGGRIASFICLGTILLVISFMYQKLKKLVIEDNPKTFPQP